MDNVVLNNQREEVLEENVLEVAQDKDNGGEQSNEVPKKNVRDCLYGRIDVSVETMDKVIVGLMIALIGAIILGVIL